MLEPHSICLQNIDVTNLSTLPRSLFTARKDMTQA